MRLKPNLEERNEIYPYKQMCLEISISLLELADCIQIDGKDFA